MTSTYLHLLWQAPCHMYRSPCSPACRLRQDFSSHRIFSFHTRHREIPATTALACSFKLSTPDGKDFPVGLSRPRQVSVLAGVLECIRTGGEEASNAKIRAYFEGETKNIPALPVVLEQRPCHTKCCVIDSFCACPAVAAERGFQPPTLHQCETFGGCESLPLLPVFASPPLSWQQKLPTCLP